MLIQVDGIRVPDGFTFGAQAAGRGDYVDLGIVRSVEILRGPASALYGSDGLAGAVSFITSDPADLLAAAATSPPSPARTYDSASDEFSETGARRRPRRRLVGRWSATPAATAMSSTMKAGRRGQGSARTGPIRRTPVPTPCWAGSSSRPATSIASA